MIVINEKTKAVALSGENFSYVIRVNGYGFPETIYYGKKLRFPEEAEDTVFIDRGHSVFVSKVKDGKGDADQMRPEISCYGQGDFHTPSFYAETPDGARITDLRVKEIRFADKPVSGALPVCDGGQTMKIVLEDPFIKLRVNLFYTVYEDSDALTRSVTVENFGENPVMLNCVSSFALAIRNRDYDHVSLVGAHMKEANIERGGIVRGTRITDSKRGVSSAQANPFVAICSKTADEDSGEVYGFNLIYSGNFAFVVQLDENNNVRISGGINPFDFGWKLGAGETFETPEAVLVYSDAGFNKMSHSFHDLYRKHLINKNFVNVHRPVVINNWEATYFWFDEEKLKAIIDGVEGTGIDTFVLDDGWFGKRNDDTSSLGDWFPNKEKLPKGLRSVSDYCHKKGLKFGLWLEPEMVNEDSVLNRAHPEWKIQVAGREPCEGRHQCVLDLTRKDVREYIINVLSTVVTEYALDYIKWDMNRGITENVSATLDADRQKEFSHRYVLGLYEILKTVTERFPNLLIEGCASGGCRFDAGMLKYCPQIWTSDNSDAYSRTIIQYGTSLVYPLSAMSCHVSVCPNHQTGRITPFVSRNDMATLGAFGFELDVAKLNDEERKIVSEKIKEYKEGGEDLVLFGTAYRLSDMKKKNLFAMQIVSEDLKTSVITVMKGLNEPCATGRIYPKGLDEDAVYSVNGEKFVHGQTLMENGIALGQFPSDFSTTKIRLIAVG